MRIFIVIGSVCLLGSQVFAVDACKVAGGVAGLTVGAGAAGLTKVNQMIDAQKSAGGLSVNEWSKMSRVAFDQEKQNQMIAESGRKNHLA